MATVRLQAVAGEGSNNMQLEMVAEEEENYSYNEVTVKAEAGVKLGKLARNIIKRRN